MQNIHDYEEWHELIELAKHEENLMIRIKKKIDQIEGRVQEKERLNPANLEWIFTYEVMKDPVATISGNSYERESLQQYMLKDPRDPLTRQPINRNSIYPNKTLKRAIEYYKQSKLMEN